MPIAIIGRCTADNQRDEDDTRDVTSESSDERRFTFARTRSILLEATGRAYVSTSGKKISGALAGGCLRE